MTNSTSKPKTWFWIFAIITLIWFTIGSSAYLMDAYMSEEALSAYSEAQQELYNSRPSWFIAAYAISVFAGLLGAILLLAKKKLSKLLFTLSFIAVIAQIVYFFFLSNTVEVMGAANMVMPILIFILGLLIIFLTNKCIKKGWLS